jgi:hypothetical protein
VEWVGLDTLVPPVLSLLSFVAVMKFGRRAEVNVPATAHGD